MKYKIFLLFFILLKEIILCDSNNCNTCCLLENDKLTCAKDEIKINLYCKGEIKMYFIELYIMIFIIMGICILMPFIFVFINISMKYFSYIVNYFKLNFKVKNNKIEDFFYIKINNIEKINNGNNKIEQKIQLRKKSRMSNYIDIFDDK